jgi:hypothetical protein
MERNIARRDGAGALRLSTRLCCLLVVACAIPFVLACTQVTTLDKAPASALRIYVRFQGALVAGSLTTVDVNVSDDKGSQVAFTGGQRIAVDGVTIPEQDSGNQHAPPVRSATVGREAPGGSYTLSYTDEHGHETIVAIPGPRENFALLDPAPGAHVPLPTPVGAGKGMPTPPATPPPYQPRPPELADRPLTIRYGLPFLPDALPPGTGNFPSRYQVRGDASGPCASKWPQYNGVRFDASPPNGSFAIDDASFIYGAGFETLAPGPGTLWLAADATWYVPDSGFAQLNVEYFDTVIELITWVGA